MEDYLGPPSICTLQWLHIVSIVCSTVCSSAKQRKYQSSASLAFVWWIHRWPVDSPHKRPAIWEKFPFDDVIITYPLDLWKSHNSLLHHFIENKLFSYMMQWITQYVNYTKFAKHNCKLLNQRILRVNIVINIAVNSMLKSMIMSKAFQP